MTPISICKCGHDTLSHVGIFGWQDCDKCDCKKFIKKEIEGKEESGK